GAGGGGAGAAAPARGPPARGGPGPRRGRATGRARRAFRAGRPGLGPGLRVLGRSRPGGRRPAGLRGGGASLGAGAGGGRRGPGDHGPDVAPAAPGPAADRRGDGGGPYRAGAGLAGRDHGPVGLARAALGLHEIGSRIWWPAGQLVAVLSEALDALADVPGATSLRLRVMASLARVLAWRGLDL